jgi:hypothetical protein
MQTLLQLQNGELQGVTKLKLSEQLSTFPEEIIKLADTLEYLDLSGNSLSELPKSLGLLKKLKVFFCSDNNFSHLPEVLADCPLLDIVGFKSNRIETIAPAALNTNLRWLILTNNKIVELPATIGNCTRMQKLMLAGNRLTALPKELQNCSNLGLLRISANRLAEIPEWLLEMPKLSWLAFSGNPATKSSIAGSLEGVEWKDLKLNQVLGQGASGIIYHAERTSGDGTQNVAVKIFKGEVTSDGLPQDEMNTCIAAGQHPGLVKLIGQLTGHPENKQGLVMELIPASFYNLGGPPSLQSCTRDVFSGDIKLTPEQALKIASTIAAVAAQLHERKIMHGDLYAHNILVDQDCNTLFGDFGAATFYTNPLFEKIEVNAFGYLLADLLSLCKEEVQNPVLAKLSELQRICQQASPSLRPSFKMIASELA